MVTYRVVVDDTDTSRISYASGWNSNPNWDRDLMSGGGTFISGPSLFEGQHSTSQNNSLTFKFSGSSIEVYGYNDPIDIDDEYDPKWTCFVDGNPIPPFIVPPLEGNNVKLCENDNLDDGDHILEVRVVSRGAVFFIDRITYTPTNPINKADILWVNVTDPAFSLTDASNALDGLKFTKLKGATMSYKFTGTKLMWFGLVLGDLPHGPATVGYSIDGGRPKNVSLAGLPLKAPSNPNETLSNQLIFSTEQLSLQPHTITATYHGFYETPLALSYVYIFNATFQPAPPPPSHTSQVPSPSSSTSLASSIGQERHLPVKTIVGGVVGGIAAMLVLFLLLWRRRRLQRIFAESKPTLLGGSSRKSCPVTPFTFAVPSALQAFRGPFVKPRLNFSSSRPPLRSDNEPNVSGNGNGAHDLASSSEPPNMDGPIHKSLLRPVQPTVRPVRHQDSGLRLPAIEENVVVEELPPEYTVT